MCIFHFGCITISLKHSEEFMTEKRKRLPWLWWTFAAFMLLVVYPLSSGPVCWLAHQLDLLDSPIFAPFGYAYCPLMLIGLNEIHPLSDWLIPYWRWWNIWDL